MPRFKFTELNNKEYNSKEVKDALIAVSHYIDENNSIDILTKIRKSFQ